MYQLLHNLLLFNSPYATCRLVYHEVWIIASPFLQLVNKPPIKIILSSQHFSVSLYLPLCPLSGSTTLLLPGNILIPSPQEPARDRHMLHTSEYIIYGAIRYTLRNGSMKPPNVLINWLQNLRLQVLLWQWPLPSSFPNSPIFHPWNTPSNSMVEPLHNL